MAHVRIPLANGTEVQLALDHSLYRLTITTHFDSPSEIYTTLNDDELNTLENAIKTIRKTTNPRAIEPIILTDDPAETEIVNLPDDNFGPPILSEGETKSVNLPDEKTVK